ncbi:MAG TPA: response regulator transcription factor [Iamia sp.]|nr:response regulator transcription factor [Iamia sp.]
MRVLLLEDEARLSGAFARRLRHDGFAVDEVATLAEVRTAVLDVAYDCLVLDRHVPDGDSLDLLPELARAEHRAPVVMVSANGDADARIQGLSEGADDYVAKPVRLDELALRVGKVVTRRDPAADARPVIRLGPVCIDLARREVTSDGQAVHLSPIQYSVFEQLVRHRDRMLTTEELLEHCWDGRRDPFSNPLHTQITRLRKIFKGALRIASVRGAGYRVELDAGPPDTIPSRPPLG